MKTSVGILLRSIAGSIILSALASPQWLNYPTPGIPRTADGKPNLSAPAPRTADGKPDLSRLWRTVPATSGETDKAMHNVKRLPWAQELDHGVVTHLNIQIVEGDFKAVRRK